MFEIQLQPEDFVEYIPDFQNNRELAEAWIESDGPEHRTFFWVNLMPMSGHDYSKAHGHAFKKARKDGDFISSATLLRNRLISKYVPVVSGLKAVDREGRIHQPKNGYELVEMIGDGYPALDDILDDICEALKDKSRADEGDLKKWRQRSAGSSLETMPRITGDAQDATPTTSTTKTDRQKKATA